MVAPCTLVTGASGFIGSRLVRALVERGVRVKALVRASSSLAGVAGLPADRFQLAFGDIMVEHSVYAALAGCDRLFHVAANFKMWDPRPERILDPAIAGTRAVLEAARRRDLEKIVVTSSCASLGATTAPEEMDESHEFNLDDAETYIVAKERSERVAFDYAERGLPIVVVLPAGVFGPGDRKPTPSGDGILKYLGWPPSLPFPVTDGGIDIVDVDDVVSGHLLAMERGRVGERYILGGENVTFGRMFGLLHEITGLAEPGGATGRGMAVLGGTLVELAARVFGFEPPLTRRLARDYATGYVWVTSEKAERELGYEHRPALETLTRAVKWFLEHGYVGPTAARRIRLLPRTA